MRRTMDAFIQAVEDARRRLIREEGQNVSMREMIRRAGYTDSERAGVMYHLNTRATWPRGHKVPPELVERLAKVMPISHEELARAAQVAAGYNVDVSSLDLPAAAARYFDDREVPDGQRALVVARLLEIIADDAVRRARSAD
jgi:hypothetical protein